MKRAGRRIIDRNTAASGICVCRKKPYITLRVAVRATHDAEARGEGRHRVYSCPNKARTWHITHMTPHGVEEEISE